MELHKILGRYIGHRVKCGNKWSSVPFADFDWILHSLSQSEAHVIISMQNQPQYRNASQTIPLEAITAGDAFIWPILKPTFKNRIDEFESFHSSLPDLSEWVEFYSQYAFPDEKSPTGYSNLDKFPCVCEKNSHEKGVK
jgi:hypothetical protein